MLLWLKFYFSVFISDYYELNLQRWNLRVYPTMKKRKEFLTQISSNIISKNNATNKINVA